MLVIYLFAADSAYQSANEVQRQAKCDGDGFRAFGPANPKKVGFFGGARGGTRTRKPFGGGF